MENYNRNANFLLEFSIENAEMVWNYPWKMTVFC